ncbi:MAG: leucine-rich repeat protein, partial [Oscillospiraceae bacterium]|nr:leucine-rich repeat protein [Oscillospiraceae bacterium]
HTAECHYAEAVAGTPCGHEHTAECYTAGVLPDGDSFDVYATGEDTNALNCQHQHDDTCGYVAAVEAHDCHFECAECAAPACDCGTDDESIHATTCAVYVAPENPVCYCAEKCTEVNEWCDVCGFDISKCTGTDTAVGYAEGDVASVTVGDTTTNYTSLDDALIAAQNNPGSTLTLLQNIDRGSEELMIRSVPDSTFTIDLNGCTLTSTTATGTVFIQTSVNLTVVDSKGTGGIISNNNAFYIDWNNTTVNIKGVTITVTSTLDYDACVFINNSSATVNIIDSTILSERVGVYGGGTLNISGDTRITATSSNMAAIHRTGGALTITGGSITGGVYVAGGTADIIGGTITEPRDYYNAVDVVNNAQVTISGGSISGVNADLCNDSYNPGVINLTLSEGKTVGATFPSGITIEGNTLAELLATDTAAYWGVVDGKDTMLTVADDAATGITDKGAITIRAICDHKDVKLDYITTETTHTPVCSVCNWTGEATEHTGGTATCQDPAICEACGVSYGDLDANIHTPTEDTIFTVNDNGTHSYTCACGTAVAEVPHTLDVTTGKCVCGADMTAIATVTDGTNTYYAADAATLNQAVTAILETGSRTFTVELPADAEAGMITAIRRAICDTEGVADGSINLTLKGVTSIPGTTNWDGVAFGPGDIYDEAGEIVDQELVTQLASINLPDVTEIGAQAFYFCENLVSVSAPKAQTIGAQALGYTALTSVEFPELTTIPTDMFSGTWTLSSAKFPKVTTIEQGGLLVG